MLDTFKCPWASFDCGPITVHKTVVTTISFSVRIEKLVCHVVRIGHLMAATAMLRTDYSTCTPLELCWPLSLVATILVKTSEVVDLPKAGFVDCGLFDMDVNFLELDGLDCE